MHAAERSLSQEHRAVLKDNYCFVPDVLNSLKLERYFHHAKVLYDQAQNEKDLDKMYIFWMKLAILVSQKMPAHSSWRQTQYTRDVTWSLQCGRQCVAALENVKTKMDQREIERRDAAVNEMLIDEFDPEDEPEEPPQAEEVATAVVIAEPTPLDVLPSAPLEEGVASIGDVFASLRTPAAEIDQGRPSVKSTHSVSMAEAVDDLTAMETSAGSEDRFAGVSLADLEILRRIGPLRNFVSPRPSTSEIELTLSRRVKYRFYRDDYHVSLNPFLRTVPPELQMARPAIETNRCFFVHLGIAMNLHPFAIEVALRNMAARSLRRAAKDDVSQNLLPTVLEYAAFVDANALIFLWPEEFNDTRVCFISGDLKRPIFTCFSKQGVDQNSLRDVIIHCDGSHFTLLRPVGAGPSFSVLPQLLADAKAQRCTVQEHAVTPCMSVVNTIKMLLPG